MKALVVYDSTYGNTEKAAEALSAGPESGGVEVETLRVDAVRFNELSTVDLLCVGSPVHAWNASKPTKEFLERLKDAHGVRGKKAFVFDTKAKSRLAGSATGKIEKKLKDMSLTIVKPTAHTIVKGREGPLEESAEEAFKQIGADLAKSL